MSLIKITKIKSTLTLVEMKIVKKIYRLDYKDRAAIC